MNYSIIIAGYISSLFVLSYVLLKAANLSVSAAHAIIARSHANKFGLVAFFVALSQWLPVTGAVV